MRTYGQLEIVSAEKDLWVLSEIEPHVAIRLKAIFGRIAKGRTGTFTFPATDELSNDLQWFESRYALRMTERDRDRLKRKAKEHRKLHESMNLLMDPSHDPPTFKINGDLRDYQARAVEMYLRTRRLVVGDAVGLGKTLVAIGSFADPSTIPALVVVQAHLPRQWMSQIVKFLGCRVHIIKGTKPYPLPQAEVYITTYSRIAGWVDILSQFGFKSIVFDEVQELRRSESAKHEAASAIASRVDRALGLSATPVYNMGDEIFSIYQAIKPGSLGSAEDFNREWCGYGKQVKDPKALGTYLREQFLFLRRTRQDVGRELPAVNKIVHTVGHDEEAIDSVLSVARSLAVRATTGSFLERGEASRELDMLLRMTTGVAKAKFVAEYVRILLDNQEPVLLVGWHRDVYDIWLKELEDHKPVMFTGTESPSQKEESRRRFLSGESNLMIMSLRSGVGLDGLQKRCKYVVFGELDWSPAVHEQVTGRLHRDDGDDLDINVTAVYLVSDGGSDPLIVDLLGIKQSQAVGIVDPLAAPTRVHSDTSRIQALAQYVLGQRSSVARDTKLADMTQASDTAMCSTKLPECQHNLFEQKDGVV